MWPGPGVGLAWIAADGGLGGLQGPRHFVFRACPLRLDQATEIWEMATQRAECRWLETELPNSKPLPRGDVGDVSFFFFFSSCSGSSN